MNRTVIVRRVWRYHKRYSESVKRRTDNKMAKRKKDKRTNNDLHNIHIKLKIELQEPHLKPGVNSGTPEGLAVPAPLVTPVVLI